MSEPPKLLDYLIVVGPSTEIPDETSSPCIPELTVTPSPPLVANAGGDGDWDKIFTPGPAILRRFPEADNPDYPLASNVVYFCQPEGCNKERKKETSHIFMLTNTETNVRTYGVCISIPHLIDPLARAQSHNWEFENQDIVSIQEWGLLSVCILSQHQCFRFFKHCLKTLISFIDNFCGSNLSWDLLIHSKFAQDGDPKYAAVKELEHWIHRLLELPTPKDGIELLEVELEVDPAVLIGFPPLSRLPLFDLGVHELFEMLGVNLVIETFQLLLLEQKVILHSEDQGIASQCILTLVALLYPLQYLFPVIPLLPTCLPNVENLLLVPTPYFIGVCTSFLQKVSSYHCAEAWIINIDKKSISEPKMHKLQRPEFPLTLLSLQADIRRSLDKLPSTAGSPLSPMSSEVSLPTIACTTNPQDGGVCPEDEVDVQIRLAFSEFLMADEMLGLVENHLAIYRLFPRPVVSLKVSSFLKAYNGDKDFMKMFVKSQSVEYYLEWSLNPSNKAFEEIKKGFCNIDNIGDKLSWWIQRTRPTRTQYTLYLPEPTSILYQEMLNHKATQSTSSLKHSPMSDDSEFELVGHEYYNEGSDVTSSYYSDNGSSPFPSKTDSNTIPVSIEFHPATPTNVHTITTSSAPAGQIPNETFLSLQEDAASPSDIELKDFLASSPEPLSAQSTSPDEVYRNSSPECTSVREEETNIDDSLSKINGDFSSLAVDSESNKAEETQTTDTTSKDKPSFHNPGDYLNENNLTIAVPSTDNSSIKGEGQSTHLTLPSLEGQQTMSPQLQQNMLSVDYGQRGATPDQQQHRSIPKSSSWMNLTGGSIEMLQFNTSSASSTSMHSTQTVDRINGALSPGPQPVTSSSTSAGVPDKVIRSVPWSAVSSLHELEMQIKDIVGRIGDGNGLPWYKPQALKAIASEERSRIALLRVLEVRIGLRNQTETKLSADGEIKPVVLTRQVYKGVLELLKYLLQFVEAELVKDMENSMFSLFLILRLALCLCTKSPRKRSQSTRLSSTKDKENSNSLFRSSSLRRNKTVKSTSPPIDHGSSSLSPLTVDNNRECTATSSSREHSPLPGEEAVQPTAIHNMPTDQKNKPQEIELQQIARDSVLKRPPPLIKTPSKKVMISSPTSQGGEEAPLTYLHNDLIRELGPSFRDFVVKRQFWSNVFISVVHTDRKYLGWNEKTSELYDRYTTLSTDKRADFAYEEDTLLSVILHNVLVFLLMMGVSPKDTIDLCHRLSAKTRLATIEEKLLQQTLTELEDADPSGHIDVKDLAVLSLYSETHSVVIFVVHHGVNVTAPIFKLQITDDVCILRRFPDEKITCRFWNDCISNISCNEDSMTVSFYYQESLGEYTHHFHSKQFSEVYQCLQMLVNSEQRTLSSIIIH